MPLYLDTRGRSTLGIGICGRCSTKMSLDELFPDPNAPGLHVCKDDLDVLDPWRLAPRETESITLDEPRPDVPLAPGPMSIYADAIQMVLGASAQPGGPVEGVGTGLPAQGIAVAPPVTVEQQSRTWQAGTYYALGAGVTSSNAVGPDAVGNLFAQFLCIVPGLSGAGAPAWNNAPGSETTDNQAIWLNIGLYLP